MFRPRLSGKHVLERYTPLNPRLYSKTGVCRGIPIFFFLLQSIDCGFSLEPPRCTHNLCFEQKIRKILIFFSLKFSIFKAQKNIWLLQGQGFVMLPLGFAF